LEQEGTLSRHLTGRRSFSGDPSKTDNLSHWVDQATPLQLAGRHSHLSFYHYYFYYSKMEWNERRDHGCAERGSVSGRISLPTGKSSGRGCSPPHEMFRYL